MTNVYNKRLQRRRRVILDWSTNVIKTESSLRFSLSAFSTGPPPFLLFSSNGTSSSSTSTSCMTPVTTIEQPGMAELLLSADWRSSVNVQLSIFTGFTADFFNNLSATVHEHVQQSQRVQLLAQTDTKPLHYMLSLVPAV